LGVDAEALAMANTPYNHSAAARGMVLASPARRRIIFATTCGIPSTGDATRSRTGRRLVARKTARLGFAEKEDLRFGPWFPSASRLRECQMAVDPHQVVRPKDDGPDQARKFGRGFPVQRAAEFPKRFASPNHFHPCPRPRGDRSAAIAQRPSTRPLPSSRQVVPPRTAKDRVHAGGLRRA
jgi:hypothetical protein